MMYTIRIWRSDFHSNSRPFSGMYLYLEDELEDCRVFLGKISEIMEHFVSRGTVHELEGKTQ